MGRVFGPFIAVSFAKELDSQLQWIREKCPNIARCLVRMGHNTPLPSRNRRPIYAY